MNKNSDIKDIKHLLSLYYDGKTSIEQEQYLLEYFTRHDEIPEEFFADKQLFITLNANRQKQYENVPENIETQFASFIDNLAEKENKKRFYISKFYRVATAACIALILGVGVYFYFNNSSNKINDDYLLAESTHIITDEKEAYKTTQMALTLLSQNLSKSNKALNSTNNQINDINNKLKNILK